MTFKISIASISIQSDLLIVWLRRMLDETLRAIQFPSYPMTVNLYSTRRHIPVLRDRFLENNPGRMKELFVQSYITHAFFLLECKFVELTRVRTSSISTKSSTSHSYQTLRSSV
jgi:hypothetical protein